MQVDEERKSTDNLEIGCYENDSEDEREIKEQDKSHKDYRFALSEAGQASVSQAAAQPSTLVVCACGHSQSMAKIMFGSDW